MGYHLRSQTQSIHFGALEKRSDFYPSVVRPVGYKLSVNSTENDKALSERGFQVLTPNDLELPDGEFVAFVEIPLELVNIRAEFLEIAGDGLDILGCI